MRFVLETRLQVGNLNRPVIKTFSIEALVIRPGLPVIALRADSVVQKVLRSFAFAPVRWRARQLLRLKADRVNALDAGNACDLVCGNDLRLSCSTRDSRGRTVLAETPERQLGGRYLRGSARPSVRAR